MPADIVEPPRGQLFAYVISHARGVIEFLRFAEHNRRTAPLEWNCPLFSVLNPLPACQSVAMRRSSIGPLLLTSLLALSVVIPSTANARSLAEIVASKELRVCIAPIHPAVAQARPQGCRSDCKFEGSAYDIAGAFATSLGPDIQATFLRVGWDEQFHNADGETVDDAEYTPALLAKGECDLYPANLTSTPARQKKLSFVTLFPSRMMVIVHASKKAAFQSPEALGGMVAAVIKDTSYEAWLREQNETTYAANPVKIKRVEQEQRISAVDNGKVDFTILDSNLAIWTTRHQAKNTVVAFTVGPSESIGWAFRKEDDELQQAARRFFDSQRADPDSNLNSIWRATYGLSLTKFISLVASLK